MKKGKIDLPKPNQIYPKSLVIRSAKLIDSEPINDREKTLYNINTRKMPYEHFALKKDSIDVVTLRELKEVAKVIGMHRYSRLSKELLLDGMYVHFCFEYNPVCFKCGFDRNNDSSWNISNDIYNLIGILCYNETNKLRCKGCLESIRYIFS